MKKTLSGLLKVIIAAAPFLMIIFCAVFYLLNFAHLGTAGLIEAVTRYKPPNLIIGAIVIIGLYGLKSLSMVFPMVVLVVASGVIFDNLAVALIVNFFGVLLQITLPYLIGRYAERDLVGKILARHKNLEKAKEFSLKNETFVCYLLRVINVLPCDAVSMYFGAVGANPRKYYLGSMLGILPGMIVMTIAGGAVTEPFSPQFIVSVSVEVLFAVGSAVYYYFYKKRKKGA
ncbi:MAG: VTT domain-containing protein [Ruminococcus sp.]|jgi:uncharacterized membrane protein YdjX (TVP38/TMEM64 family)|nr:VTT domain-containing protein [Ruminococcus sp.]